MECLGGTPHTLLSVPSFSSVGRGSYKDRANERGDKGMKLEGGGVAGLWTKGLRDQQKKEASNKKMYRLKSMEEILGELDRPEEGPRLIRRMSICSFVQRAL